MRPVMHLEFFQLYFELKSKNKSFIIPQANGDRKAHTLIREFFPSKRFNIIQRVNNSSGIYRF